MIRPTSLLRSNSARPQFTAPASNISEDAIDCGITALPCCLPKWFHRLATPNWFLFFFGLLGIVQGSVQKYLSTTARHVGDIFNYPKESIDWLLISHDLFLGFFVLSIAFWGNRIHRPAWLGGLACFQGVACLLVMIPYIELQKSDNTTALIEPPTNLCQEKDQEVVLWKQDPATEENVIIDWMTLVILYILQFLIGLCNASYFAHGISYIDDNVEQYNSPLYIAIALAIRMSTFQFGTFMAWSFLSQDKSWWMGYPILGGTLLLTGTFVAMFPLKLLATVLKQTAASILDIATNNSLHRPTITPKDGFKDTMIRIMSNKIIIFLTLALVFMNMATENFLWYEADFMESQFYLPRVGVGFEDPWTSRLWKNFTKPPILALVMCISGLLIAKIKPKAHYLAGWNVIMTLIVGLLVFSYGFIDCEKDTIAGSSKGHLTTQYCSFLCGCSSSARFQPVCTQDAGHTYYSPCHAGCKEVIFINEIKVYANCSCSNLADRIQNIETMATEGACNNSNCALHWVLYQALSVFSAACLASGYVGSFLISLRSVSITDKAMVIAFQFCLVNILTHLPGKFIYKAIADANCQYYNEATERCNFYNTGFGDYISILTACLLFVSTIFFCLVVYFAKDVELVDEEVEPNVAMPMSDVTTPIRRTSLRSESTAEMNSDLYARPLRPLRASVANSGGSTRASSIQYRNPEEEPLDRDEMQRRVTEELKYRNSTIV